MNQSSLPGKFRTAEGQTQEEKHKTTGEKDKTHKVQLGELTQSCFSFFENVLIDLVLFSMTV